jgi:hypothetical protein
MKENYEDLIGKEFIAFKFKDADILSCSSDYDDIIGCKAVVINIHNPHTTYTNARITKPDGTTTQKHFPSEMIKAQIEERETEEKMNSMSVEDLLNEMKQLISRI